MKLTLIELSPSWLSSDREGIINEKAGINLECPCGCGDRLSIPLDPNLRYNQCWTNIGEDFKTLTLKPSIQRTSRCKTHFSIIDGKVIP